MVITYRLPVSRSFHGIKDRCSNAIFSTSLTSLRKHGNPQHVTEAYDVKWIIDGSIYYMKKCQMYSWPSSHPRGAGSRARAIGPAQTAEYMKGYMSQVSLALRWRQHYILSQHGVKEGTGQKPPSRKGNRTLFSCASCPWQTHRPILIFVIYVIHKFMNVST